MLLQLELPLLLLPVVLLEELAVPWRSLLGQCHTCLCRCLQASSPSSYRWLRRVTATHDNHTGYNELRRAWALDTTTIDMNYTMFSDRHTLRIRGVDRSKWVVGRKLDVYRAGWGSKQTMTSLDHIFTIHSFDTPKYTFFCLHIHTLGARTRTSATLSTTPTP
jgi:hypothetical protein